MKKFINLFTIATFVFGQVAYADCNSGRSDTERECSDDKYKDITKKAQDLQNYVNQCANAGVAAAPAAAGGAAPTNLSVPLGASCTGDSMREALTKSTEAQKLSAEYNQKCAAARKDCVDSCSADAADTMNPPKQANGQAGQQYCEGKPKENEEGSKGNSDALSQMLPLLMMALMARGQKPPEAATNQLCSTDPTALAASAANNPQLASLCGTIDKASTNDSSFADGTGRTAYGDEYLGSGDLAQGIPAAGNPAQAQLSGTLPGGGGAGGMAAASTGGGFAGGSSSGKKGSDDGSKLNLASAPGGGGGGGGGSMAGMGGNSRPGPAGAPPSRTPIDGPDKGMQAAVEKAAQQRGIASDGPAGGISGANSLDNFQKVEKRMQSERNNLSEL
jgi:hypothetical protein